MRHNPSSESHHNSAATTLAKLFNLFRSKSDNSVKSHSKSGKQSATTSPSVQNQPRRRFLRVVRDAEARAPEVIDDNPHIICRYSQGFLEEHYKKSQEELSSRPLPYVTSGHTILKKSSTDPTPCEQHSPTTGKHATFKDVVEVIEFSGHDVVQTAPHICHEARLHDDETLPPGDDTTESGFFLKHESVSSENETSEDQETMEEAFDDDVEEVAERLPRVDLDRMDGVLKNIFSSVSNHHEASPDPPKIRRVELSELLSNCDDSVEDRAEAVKCSFSSSSHND